MRDFRRSWAMLEESKRYLAGGVSTRMRSTARPFPLFFERGQGPCLYDVDGNRYIDYCLGWGPLIHGHSHPYVVKKVQEQVARGQTFGAQHQGEIDLAKHLTELIPSADLVCFSNSGTEAVMSALRIARAFTGRNYVIKFEGHYHGWSDGVLISYQPNESNMGPERWPNRVPGNTGMCPNAMSSTLVAVWNDLDNLKGLMEKYKGQVAAVIMEPYACNTGVIFPKPGYLEGVRQLCDEHGALLIFDEVITGFRVGLNSAQGRLGVMPDLSTLGKAVGGGFPIGVVAGVEKVMSIVVSGKVAHVGTFNGNPVVTSASCATIELLRENNGSVYGRMEELGLRLAEGLTEAGAEAGVPVLAYHIGSVVFTHLTSEKKIAQYRDVLKADKEKFLKLSGLLVERGVMPQLRGIWYLSTVHTSEDIEETIEKAKDAFKELSSER